jgi:hypothetical protein
MIAGMILSFIIHLWKKIIVDAAVTIRKYGAYAARRPLTAAANV